MRSNFSSPSSGWRVYDALAGRSRRPASRVSGWVESSIRGASTLVATRETISAMSAALSRPAVDVDVEVRPTAWSLAGDDRVPVLGFQEPSEALAGAPAVPRRSGTSSAAGSRRGVPAGAADLERGAPIRQFLALDAVQQGPEGCDVFGVVLQQPPIIETPSSLTKRPRESAMDPAGAEAACHRGARAGRRWGRR